MFTRLSSAVYAALPLWIAIMCAASCASQSEASAEATKRWLQAEASRDAATLWEMLAPDDKASIAALFDDVKALNTLVLTIYPPVEVESARSQSGLAAFDEVNSPKALFSVLLGQTSAETALSRFQVLGMHVTSAPESADGVVTKTLAGDTVQFIRDGETLYVPLSADDRNRLAKMQASVKALQQSIRSQSKDMASRRL